MKQIKHFERPLYINEHSSNLRVEVKPRGLLPVYLELKPGLSYSSRVLPLDPHTGRLYNLLLPVELMNTNWMNLEWSLVPFKTAPEWLDEFKLSKNLKVVNVVFNNSTKNTRAVNLDWYYRRSRFSILSKVSFNLSLVSLGIRT